MSAELTILVGAIFIGTSTVISILKRNLVSCDIFCCKCKYNDRVKSSDDLSARSENDGLLTTRVKENLKEVDRDESVVRKSINLSDPIELNNKRKSSKETHHKPIAHSNSF